MQNRGGTAVSKTAEARSLVDVPYTVRRHEALSTVEDLIVRLLYLAADIHALSPNAAHVTKGAAELLDEARKDLENALKPDVFN
jgi:hypothetical protein